MGRGGIDMGRGRIDMGAFRVDVRIGQPTHLGCSRQRRPHPELIGDGSRVREVAPDNELA